MTKGIAQQRKTSNVSQDRRDVIVYAIKLNEAQTLTLCWPCPWPLVTFPGKALAWDR